MSWATHRDSLRTWRNAYSKISIKKIFKLKGRPSSNPLIIHYYNLDDAVKDVVVNKHF